MAGEVKGLGLTTCERAIVERGGWGQRYALAHDTVISDAVRLALHRDPEPSVRWAAVHGAQSAETRLAFRGDAEEFVRVAAVRGATADGTRLAFLDDESPLVRVAAARRMDEPSFLPDALAVEHNQSAHDAMSHRLRVLEARRVAASEQPDGSPS